MIVGAVILECYFAYIHLEVNSPKQGRFQPKKKGHLGFQVFDRYIIYYFYIYNQKTNGPLLLAQKQGSSSSLQHGFFFAQVGLFVGAVYSRETDEVYLSRRWVKTLSSRLLICSPPKHSPATEKWWFLQFHDWDYMTQWTDEKHLPFVRKQLQINEFEKSCRSYYSPNILLGLQG